MPVLDPYQETGAAFLAARPIAVLADEPGAGKTPQVIRALDLARTETVLYACPAATRRNVEYEFSVWSPDRLVAVHEGYPKGIIKGATNIVAHDALSHRASFDLMRTRTYDAVVVDESHALASMGSNRTAAVWNDHGLWRRTRHLWCLTGSPILNSAADLYPMFHAALAPECGMDWMGFAGAFADLRPDGFNGWRSIGIKDPEGLAALVRPYVLRRTLEGVGIDLPPLSMRAVPVPVEPADLVRIMADLEGWTPERLVERLESQDEVRDTAISRARHALGRAKARFAALHVANVFRDTATPPLAFFQHTAVGSEMVRQDFPIGMLDGKQSKSAFRGTLDRYQTGQLAGLCVQTQCGGTGLNLVQSNRVVVAELPWTAAALEQAVKRAHRRGQASPVHVDVLLAGDCWIDEVVFGVVMRKRKDTRAFLSLLESDG